MATYVCRAINFFIVHNPVYFLTKAMIFHAHLLSCIEHFSLNFSDPELTTSKFTPFLMLYHFTTATKSSLMQNSLPTSKSPESNEELMWPDLLCDSFANSNPSSVDMSTLCMWAGGKYTLNRGPSSASSYGSSLPSPSSGSVGSSSGSENNVISKPSAPGCWIGLASDSLPSSF